MSSVREALVGTWVLESFRVTFSDGRAALEPFDRGYIVYTADGTMSAILTRAERPLLGAGSLERAARATEAQKAEAFDGYLSYAGRYRLEGEDIVHEVEYALVPDIVGTELRRQFTLASDGSLVLRYHLITKKDVRVDYTLTWTRANTP